MLGAGLTSGTLTVTRSTTDLDDVTLSFGASGSITLDEQFYASGPSAGIETIQFGDGEVWTKAQLLAVVLGDATAGNDTLTGGPGADLFFGSDGDDLLKGLEGNDTLIGELGVDRLEGGAGSDVYRFNSGDGADKIYETYYSGTDRLVLGEGLTAANMTIVRAANGGNDVTLDFGAAGSIFLDEQFYANSGSSGVEVIEFADGTTWSKSALLAEYISRSQTSQDDMIYGGAGSESLSGGQGNDRLEGLAGYDTLWGGAGADDLIGGSDPDTYRFALGDGSDWVIELHNAYGDVDRVILGTGLVPGALTVTRRATDLDDAVLTFGGGDSLTLDELFATSGNGVGVERIEFADERSGRAPTCSVAISRKPGHQAGTPSTEAPAATPSRAAMGTTAWKAWGRTIASTAKEERTLSSTPPARTRSLEARGTTGFSAPSAVTRSSIRQETGTTSLTSKMARRPLSTSFTSWI